MQKPPKPHDPDADELDLSEDVLDIGTIYSPYRMDQGEGFVENLERKIDDRLKHLEQDEIDGLDSPSWDDEDEYATPEDWEDEA